MMEKLSLTKKKENIGYNFFGMLSLLRVIKFALQDIGRSLSLSFMTILILVFMLLSLNSFIIIKALTAQAITSVKEQIDVSIFFQPEVTDEEVKEIRQYVESFPEVKEIIYYDRAQVLEQFKQTHKDNTEILASLTELNENPLGPTMVVKTRDPKDYEKIIESLNVPEYDNRIEAKNFGDTQKAIERINTITANVENFVFALSALFTLIAFVVIFNTIRVSIYTQRTEITIKKLVGATNWFIRGPYIIEALIFSVMAVVITYAIVYFGLGYLEPYMDVLLGVPSFLTNYFNSHILLLLAVQFGVVFALTIVTSLLAMRKYLRV